MSGDPDKERMKALEERIAAAKKPKAPKPRSEESHSQAELGWRMVIELVAGLAIGFGLGYGLDTLFGTLPILMIVFTGLGFAAGVRVMLRSAQEFQAKQADPGTGDDTDEGT